MGISHQSTSTGGCKMSVEVYTANIPLTQKAQFWSTWLSALKGNQALRASDPEPPKVWQSSIVDTLPQESTELKHEFEKLEAMMYTRDASRANTPLTPVLPGAHDRIFTGGYKYQPIHNEIYGSFQAKTARVS